MEEIKAAPIRVEEFAKIVGTTPTNIRGHIKKYAAELEGHIEVKPKKGGTFLDNFAQNFIKGKMRVDTVVVYDNRVTELLEENNKLLHQINELLTETTELKLAATRHLELQQAHEDLQLRLEAEIAEAAELRIESEKQKSLIDKLTTDLESAEETNNAIQAEANALIAQIETLKNRTLWQRIRNK